MNKKLMTNDEYTANLEVLKKLFVDLDISDLSPDTINTKICEVQNNFNKAGRYAIDSINNLHYARTMVDTNKLNKELTINAAMTSPDVAENTKLKSADMRAAAASNMAAKSAEGLRASSEDKLMAEAYHLSVMYVHGNLERSIDVLREKIKLFQSMLYLDPTGHR